MLFTWYSGELCTDPAFAELEPEFRANPSITRGRKGRPISSNNGAGCRHSSSAGCISICLAPCPAPSWILTACSRRSWSAVNRSRRCGAPPMPALSTCRADLPTTLVSPSPTGRSRQSHRRLGGEASRRRAVQSQGRGAQVCRHPAGLWLARVTGDAYGGETFKLRFPGRTAFPICPAKSPSPFCTSNSSRGSMPASSSSPTCQSCKSSCSGWCTAACASTTLQTSMTICQCVRRRQLGGDGAQAGYACRLWRCPAVYRRRRR